MNQDIDETIDDQPQKQASYFVVVNGARMGPYSHQQLEDKLAENLLTLDSPVCQVGRLDWQPLHEILNLSIPVYIPPDASRGPSRLWPFILGVGVGVVLTLVFIMVRPMSPLRAEVPIRVSFRPSMLEASLVGIFQNQGERTLSTEVKASAPNGQTRNWQLVLQPGEAKEIGWMEGWRFTKGESLTITHPDFRTKTIEVPGP